MTASAASIWVSISACSAGLHRGTLALMKPTLQFRLSQHLTLTPQLQQSIRLLQLSTVELNQEIERMLMENPILEREDVEGDAQAAFAPPRDTTQGVADAATLATDHDALEHLDALARALDDADVDLQRVTRAEGRDVGAQRLGVKCVQDVHRSSSHVSVNSPEHVP